MRKPTKEVLGELGWCLHYLWFPNFTSHLSLWKHLLKTKTHSSLGAIYLSTHLLFQPVHCHQLHHSSTLRQMGRTNPWRESPLRSFSRRPGSQVNQINCCSLKELERLIRNLWLGSLPEAYLYQKQIVLRINFPSRDIVNLNGGHFCPYIRMYGTEKELTI